MSLPYLALQISAGSMLFPATASLDADSFGSEIAIEAGKLCMYPLLSKVMKSLACMMQDR